MKRTILVLSLMSLLQACSSEDKVDTDPNPEIDLTRGGYQCFTMTTSLGDIKLALDQQRAPKTTDNFTTYVNDGFYDGTLIHRVESNFMVQGGGYESITKETTVADKKETRGAIQLESDNGLKNYRGRIAMARTAAPDSATSQFFINVVDNHFLNKEQANDGLGYAVFGGVISGMDVVDQIRNVEIGEVGEYKNVPIQDIVINSVTTSTCPAS